METAKAKLYHHTVTLASGRHVALFVNLSTGLVVVDVVRADEGGGNEILRCHANAVQLPTARECEPQELQP